jgi:hypothetical protein
MRVHKIILEARSPVFHALLTSPMRESQEGRVKVRRLAEVVWVSIMVGKNQMDCLSEKES